jgi:hypothetical protein
METLLSLNDLDRMGRTQLMRAWFDIFGVPAPSHVRPGLLKPALAWQLQLEAWELQNPENSIKRLHQQLQRKLTDASSQTIRKTMSLNAGTQIVREWNGNTYRVSATDDEYEYAGQTYKSLTAISKLITGTAWSGPKFFGVVK